MGISMFTVDIFRQYDERRFNTVVDAFSHYVNMGVEYGEIFNLKDYPLYLYNSIMKEAGMKFGSYISTTDIISFDKTIRERNIASLKHTIDALEKIKVPLIMITPLSRAVKSDDELKKSQDMMISVIDDLLSYTKGSGIALSIENYSEITRPDGTIESIKRILDALPELKFVLDMGNFFCIKQDVLKAYELFKDRIVNAHCKDWKFSKYGDFQRANIERFDGCIPGQGEIPIAQLISKMKQDGYKGNFVVEINSYLEWEKYDEAVLSLKSMIN